jgi:hypothetical protein
MLFSKIKQSAKQLLMLQKDVKQKETLRHIP